jgi:hypothetical protein
MTTILERLSRATSARTPRVTLDVAKRAQVGENLWRGDVPTHYHVRTPLPEWLTSTTHDPADEPLAAHFREDARQFPPHVVSITQDLRALEMPASNDKQ